MRLCFASRYQCMAHIWYSQKGSQMAGVTPDFLAYMPDGSFAAVTIIP
jgi:hypothetical protein